MARRLLVYADLDDRDVDLVVFRRTADDTHRAADGSSYPLPDDLGPTPPYASAKEYPMFIDVLDLIDDDLVVAALSYQVARAFRAVHRLGDDAQGEVHLIDVTAVYLGFGVIGTNGAFLYRSRGSGMHGIHWSERHLGDSTAGEMAYLLAAQMVARRSEDEVRRVTSALETTQADLFRRAVAELDPFRPRLLADLGLPTEWSWPAKKELAPFVRSLGAGTEEQYEDTHPHEVVERDFRGDRAPVFRIRMRRTGRYALFAFLIGTIPAALLGQSGGLLLSFAALAGSSAIGALIGRKVVLYECSRCERYLTRDETACLCGGVVEGTIGSKADRLAAEDDLERGVFRSIE
jgi:hypothetical protein